MIYDYFVAWQFKTVHLTLYILKCSASPNLCISPSLKRQETSGKLEMQNKLLNTVDPLDIYCRSLAEKFTNLANIMGFSLDLHEMAAEVKL